MDISAEEDPLHRVQNQQASDNIQVEGSSGGECKSQTIKVVTYDDILKPQKTSGLQPTRHFKSQQDRVE